MSSQECIRQYIRDTATSEDDLRQRLAALDAEAPVTPPLAYSYDRARRLPDGASEAAAALRAVEDSIGIAWTDVVAGKLDWRYTSITGMACVCDAREHLRSDNLKRLAAWKPA